MKVHLRPLQEADADKSWHWRNDPRVWRFTGNRPTKLITPAIEREWLRNVLTRSDEIRFAICLGDKYEYVGNAQLTSITNADAEYHIFIGDINYHGKGIGSKTTELVIDYAKIKLGLMAIYLHVHSANTSAIRAYEKCGFILNDKLNNRLLYKLDL